MNAYLTSGASSNDSLTGTSENDTLRGGRGRDYLSGGRGSDTYLFQLGDGQDTIYDVDPFTMFDTSSDRLIFSGAGLTTANAIVTRVNGDNDLRISFKGLSDSVTFLGMAYTYSSAPLDGVETVTFSDGVIWNKEQLLGSYMGVGASTNDSVYGTGGNNAIRGGRGQDYLDGRSGADTYLFQLGDGQDTINDVGSSIDTGSDRLIFAGAGLTAANATVNRVNGNNDLRISFKGLSDSVTFSYLASKYAQPFEASMAAQLTDGVETITFSDGTVWNEAQLLGAYMGVGASTNDRIFGTAGNNTIRGGRGQDSMNGGDGADTYLFQLGDGQDNVRDWALTSLNQGSDRLIFSGAGLTAANAIVTRLPSSSGYSTLKISFKGLSDSVALTDRIPNSPLFTNDGTGLIYSPSLPNDVTRDGIETVTFSDGTVWNKAKLWNNSTVQTNLNLTGTSANDTIAGGTGDDRLYGLEGSDTLRGGRGEDYLDGGQGADTYSFQLGDGGDWIQDSGYDNAIDTLIFSGLGLTSTNAIVTRLDTSSDLQITFTGLSDLVLLKDQLSGGISNNVGVERVQFSNGVTWNKAQVWNAYLTQGAASDDNLIGTNAADTLKGGLGYDILDGALGADTYLFQQGDGGDTIKDLGYDNVIDTLIFSGSGLTSTNAIVTRLGISDDLQITFAGLSDAVLLKDQVYGGIGYNYGVERVQFSNGVTWNEAQLWNAYLTQGAASDDRLLGTDAAETLKGGLGYDILDGGLGADIYLFQQGDGGDTIKDSGYDSVIDTLTFSGSGLTSTNAIVTRLGTSDDLQIGFVGLSDSVMLKDQIYGGIGYNYGIERVQFSNGVSWNEAQLWNAYLTQGEASDDYLRGTDVADILKGGRGNDFLDGKYGADTYLFQLGDGGDTISDTGYDNVIDTLIFSGSGLTSTNAIVTRLRFSNDLQINFTGLSDSVVLKDQLYGGIGYSSGIERIQFSNGVSWTEAQIWNAYLTQGAASDDYLTGTDVADILKGGRGNDFLDGGLGADTYYFQVGEGSDTLSDTGYDNGVDKLVFSGNGLTSSNVRATRNGNDVQLSFGGTSDSVLLKNQLNSGNYGLESIQFSNGVSWNRSQLSSALR